MPNKVSIVIPAKNEELKLAAVLEGINQLGDMHEVIVVNDGSTDATEQLALSLGAKVVSHPVSLGNGAAIKSGARAATGDYILFMDADGQHRPRDIPMLVHKALDEGWDMLVGARDRSGQSTAARYIANTFYNWFASKVTGQKILDLTSGFRIVRRSLFLKYLHLLPNGFSYPTTITMALLRGGYKVDYQSLQIERSKGKSHISPMRDGLKFLIIIFKVATLYSPLKVFVPIAMMHFLLGLARYAYTYFEFGSFTNMSALLMVTGVQIFLIGLVSEQIASLIYRE